MTSPSPDLTPQPKYVLIDGDGHHNLEQDEIEDRIIDLVLSNDETTFRVSRTKFGPMIPEVIIVEVS